jgi:hypothetical protein
MATRRELDAINRGASFAPQTSGSVAEDEWDGTRPCLTVAGVQVYAYVETVDITEGPRLIVSVDYDTAGDSEHTKGLPTALGFEDDGDVLGWRDGQGGEGIPTEVRVGAGLRLTLDREGGMRLEADR